MCLTYTNEFVNETFFFLQKGRIYLARNGVWMTGSSILELSQTFEEMVKSSKFDVRRDDLRKQKNIGKFFNQVQHMLYKCPDATKYKTNYWVVFENTWGVDNHKPAEELIDILKGLWHQFCFA